LIDEGGAVGQFRIEIALPAQRIVFNKGQSSSGGTISVAGGSVVNLRTTVQPVSYTDNGVVWQ
jgi:hypothetical protein